MTNESTKSIPKTSSFMLYKYLGSLIPVRNQGRINVPSSLSQMLDVYGKSYLLGIPSVIDQFVNQIIQSLYQH